MLHKEIPFFRICVSLCAGIVSGLFIEPEPVHLVVAGIIILLLFLISLPKKQYSDNPIFGIAMSCSFFLCGLILYRNEKASLSSLEPKTSVFSCELSDYPDEKPGSILLTARLNSAINGSGYSALKGSMLLYFEKDEEIMRLIPGDKLVVRCKPAPLTNRGNPGEFDYKFYMENLGIKYVAFPRKNDLINHMSPAKRKLVHKALIIRRKIIAMYSHSGVSDERLALVSALTLGEKSNLDNEQKESFMKAGIMHVMAVSGLHAVILSMFVMNVLFFMKRKLNILRVLLSILFLWTFAFVTGLTPSVMRATLMFTFIQAGNLMHRRVNGINSVLASAFVLIIVNPSVIFNAGFLLSYSAVIFIIAFYRDLYLKIRPGNRIADWIWQSVVVTIVAQTGTLPFTIMFFNRFPVYFILTNLIIVPLSSLAIILGCLIPLFYPVAFIPGLLGFALDKLTALILYLTAHAASLPLSGIENIGMMPVQSLILISIISALMYILLSKRTRSLMPVFMLLVLYAGYGAIKDIRIKSTNELIVYNSFERPVAGIRTGKILNLYCDTSLIPPEVRRHVSAMGLRVKMHMSDKTMFVKAGDKIIQVGSGKPGATEIQPDYIIMKDYRKPVVNGTVILTGNNRKISPKYLSPDSKAAIYLIRESGAYISRL